ncbi:MAG: acetolactate synthase 3 large subunit, partial [Pseudomonadota bacterium]
FASGPYIEPEKAKVSHYQPQTSGDTDMITELVEALETAKRPIFYTGGGVINSGPEASALLRELVTATGIPITSTLMGLGAYPASGKHWIGMLGMHGLYEANMAMHDCDLLINIGARFDDRITGRLDAFSPGSKRAHIDIDPSSINKVIRTDFPVIGDIATVLRQILDIWKARDRKLNRDAIENWWTQINEW